MRRQSNSASGHDGAQGWRRRRSGGTSRDVHGARLSLKPQQLASCDSPCTLKTVPEDTATVTNITQCWRGSCSLWCWRRGTNSRALSISFPLIQRGREAARRVDDNARARISHGPRLHFSLPAYVYPVFGCGPSHAYQCAAVAKTGARFIWLVSRRPKAKTAAGHVVRPLAVRCLCVDVGTEQGSGNEWCGQSMCADRRRKVRDLPCSIYRVLGSICPSVRLGSGKAVELDALFSSASQIHTHTLSHNFSSATLNNTHTCTRSHPFRRVKCLRTHCTHSPLTAFHTQHEQLFRPDGCSPHESTARCSRRLHHCRGVGYAG